MANYNNPYYGGAVYLHNLIRKASEEFTGKKVQAGNTAPGQGSAGSNAAESLPSQAKPSVKIPSESPGPVSQPAVNENILSINRDNLIKGMIFAEILGTPKGRRTGRW